MQVSALSAGYVPATTSDSSKDCTIPAFNVFAIDEANPAQPVAAPVCPLLDGQTTRTLSETTNAATVPYAEWLAENLYAEISVNGQVVARVFRSGGCSISEGRPIPADFSWDGDGIELAKRRAYQLAKFYQGTINGVDPGVARKRWLDMSNLEEAIGKQHLSGQASAVRVAVPAEAVQPSFVEEI